jgi:hypothetical protein
VPESHTIPSASWRSWQRVLNERWPPDPRDVPEREAIPVRVRVVWERDGEEWVDGLACRWTRERVYVELRDVRSMTLGVWVSASDVRRS